MKTRKFLATSLAAASCCLLYSGFATAAAEAPSAPPASSSPAKAAPLSGLRAIPQNYPGGIRPRTAEDDKVQNKERAAQRAARSAEITSLAKKDLAAKRYKDALAKAKFALELNPGNVEAARIRKTAKPLAVH